MTNGTRYYFKVSALDKTGYESAKSDTTSGIPSTTMSYTVKSDGTGDFTSAQDAIEKAVNGDTVFIATVVYDSIRVDSKTINIIAGDGPANSIIDAKGPILSSSREALFLNNVSNTIETIMLCNNLLKPPRYKIEI